MTVDDILAVLPGLWLSLGLAALALAVGLPLGLLAGLALHEGNRATRWTVWLLTEVGRGFPALITLYLVYFGLPGAGIVLSAFPAVVVAFGYTTASYAAEIFRVAIMSVPSGQTEATAALGLSRARAMGLVILPQAIRIVTPPLIGLSVLVFQGTALAYSVGLQELLGRSYNLGTVRFDTLRFLLVAALLYLLTTVALTFAARAYQKRSAMNFIRFAAGRMTDLRTSATTGS